MCNIIYQRLLGDDKDKIGWAASLTHNNRNTVIDSTVLQQQWCDSIRCNTITLRAIVGRGREFADSQHTFKAVQGPGHTVGGAFLRNPGHWNFTQAWHDD